MRTIVAGLVVALPGETTVNVGGGVQMEASPGAGLQNALALLVHPIAVSN